MGMMHKAAEAVGKALGDVHAGSEKLLSHKIGVKGPPSMPVVSPDFDAGQALPVSATAEGEGTPPSLRWSGAPAGTRSFVVVCEDPDAPMPDPFVHWTVYGLAASTNAVDAASARTAREGKNSALKGGFTPAAPPPGHGLHHYHFQVFALDVPVELEPDVVRGTLLEAMRGHVLGWGDLVGTYERT